ncbi:MAG TPA: hypothetical protein VML55_20415 [Planctomycetaceae bacterium]|nr:hypothetical protein [Planctomycetaceae bacterium]
MSVSGRTLVLGAAVLWAAGCSGDSSADGTEGRPSHVAPQETAYFFGVPQDGQRPDGHFQAGEKMRLLEAGESWSLVRSVRGIKAYVATSDLKTKEEADDFEDD